MNEKWPRRQTSIPRLSLSVKGLWLYLALITLSHDRNPEK